MQIPSTSLLPSSLSYIEHWTTRLFLLLAFLTIGPWMFIILYDCLLYIYRVVSHEIPYFGGRARGHIRPGGSGDGRNRKETKGVGNTVLARQNTGGGGVIGEDGGIGLDGAVDGDTHGKLYGDKVTSSRGVRRLVAEEERSMMSWEDGSGSEGGERL